MRDEQKRVRVLYSFPHKIGADRICNTAWQLVNGLAAAGADVLLFPGVLHRPLPKSVKVWPTLARGRFRIPYKLLGKMRALALHDYIVARRLERLEGKVDIVHTWPMAAMQTLKTAAKIGIPTVLERPNAHTRFAYEIVQSECERLGISMPPGHEHEYNRKTLAKEEAEFLLTDHLLCPSDFVARTFLDKGFPQEKIVRHQYGYDEKVYCPDSRGRTGKSGLTILFVGGCAPRKGVHYALEAWLQSSAHTDGTFMIAGEFIPGYAEKLSTMLAHPSVCLLGHRRDVPQLMCRSDILILPTIEEGSALVTYEARGSGCVLLVSEAAGAICTHMENALIHSVGDVKVLSQQISLLSNDRTLLERLRASSLSTTHKLTWSAAGRKLAEAYNEVLEGKRSLYQ